MEKEFSDWQDLQATLTKPRKMTLKGRVFLFFDRIKDSIEEKLTQIKYYHQRGKYGYCDEDIWNLSDNYLEHLAVLLHKFNETRHGWFPQLGYVYDNNTQQLTQVDREITEREYNDIICAFEKNLLLFRDCLNMEGQYEPDEDMTADWEEKYRRDFEILRKNFTTFLFILIPYLWD